MALQNSLCPPVPALRPTLLPGSLQQASCGQLPVPAELTLPDREYTALPSSQVPGFLLMLSTMIFIVNLMGLRVTSPQGPPCLLARLPIFLVQCAVLASH